MWDPYAGFKKIVLPNGLTLFASEVDREFEIFGFIIHAGAREDTTEKSGTAHFVEHCVSQNVSGWESKDIESYFEKQGGFANLGSTSYSNTSYMCKCQMDHKHIGEALDIFGKMLIDEALVKNIEKERSIIIQEYYLAHPFEAIHELDLFRQKCLFPNHRLANFLRPLGNLDGIKSISEENLQRFYDHFYVPANMSIIAIGKLSPESVANLLTKSPFGQQKMGQRNSVPTPCFPDYSELTRFDIKASLLFGKDNPATHGQYSSRASLPGTLDLEIIRFTIIFLRELLLLEIREKNGWSYQVDLDFQSFQDLIGLDLEIPMEVASLGCIEEAVDKCIATALDNKNLFHLIHEFTINDLVLFDVNFKKICQNAMSDVAHFSRIITNRETTQKCMSITIDDIAEVLSFLTPDKRSTTIIYP